jgi:hypothetical protein
VLKTKLMRTSDARKQLQTLRNTVEAYAPAQRACYYKMMLVGSVANEPGIIKSHPELWGHTHEAEELRQLFYELPLKQRWSLGERKSVLEKIDSMVIAHLDAVEDGDREFWKRNYYGLELTCEVTDEALATLKAQRPRTCLNFVP